MRMERADPSGRVGTPYALIKPDCEDDEVSRKRVAGILEVFCVDVSRSMWYVSSVTRFIPKG